MKALWRDQRPAPIRLVPTRAAASGSSSEKRKEPTAGGGSSVEKRKKQAVEGGSSFEKRKKQAVGGGSSVEKRKESAGSSSERHGVADYLEARREIDIIVNKRGRRCEWEYECRWVGAGADETTWEPCETLSWPKALTIVHAFEERARTQKASSILGGALSDKPWVRSKCCNSIVGPDTCDSKDRCLPLDNAACIARRLKPLPRRRQYIHTYIHLILKLLKSLTRKEL